MPIPGRSHDLRSDVAPRRSRLARASVRRVAPLSSTPPSHDACTAEGADVTTTCRGSRARCPSHTSAPCEPGRTSAYPLRAGRRAQELDTPVSADAHLVAAPRPARPDEGRDSHGRFLAPCTRVGSCKRDAKESATGGEPTGQGPVRALSPEGTPVVLRARTCQPRGLVIYYSVGVAGSASQVRRQGEDGAHSYHARPG